MRSFKTKVCQICGKEYYPTGCRQKYCTECGLVMEAECYARYRKANPKKNRACVVKFRLENPGYDADWRKANLEKVRAGNAKWGNENPEKVRAIHVKCRLANPEKYKTATAEWRKANPEKLAVFGSKYRAAKYANTPINELLTSTEWLAILAEADGYCAYCGKETKLTLDYVIPLSKGGKHSKDNIAAACQHCNSSKGNKALEEWSGRER